MTRPGIEPSLTALAARAQVVCR